jgi:hypothetical protein
MEMPWVRTFPSMNRAFSLLDPKTVIASVKKPKAIRMWNMDLEVIMALVKSDTKFLICRQNSNTHMWG